MFEEDLALYNLQWLMCYNTKSNQILYLCVYIYIYIYIYIYEQDLALKKPTILDNL